MTAGDVIALKIDFPCDWRFFSIARAMPRALQCGQTIVILIGPPHRCYSRARRPLHEASARAVLQALTQRVDGTEEKANE